MIAVDPGPLQQQARELAREAESALGWWQLAGLDWTTGDEAQALWAKAAPDPVRAAPAPLIPAKPAAEARPPAPGQPRITLGDSPPADLAAFGEWWMTAPALEPARLHPRVPPRGQAGARLMVLVGDPEEHDRERLLGDTQGRFLAAMLTAMGIGESEAYVASALPSHTPMADFAALAERGLDSVLAHHLTLAAPARLMVFGTRLTPLIESPVIRMVTAALPVTINEDLRSIMGMPQLKARLWRRWIEWTAG